MATKKTATKSEILSLIGLLQHATKVVKCGCTFTGRMYTTAVKVKELATLLHKAEQRVQVRLGLVACLCPTLYSTHPQFVPFSTYHPDGLVRVLGLWSSFQPPMVTMAVIRYVFGHLEIRIMAKELVPVVLSCAVWGHFWQNCLSYSSVIT